MIKNGLYKGLVLLVVYLITGSGMVYSADPALALFSPEPIDSAGVIDYNEGSTEEKMEKEMTAFYSDNELQASKKSRSKLSRNKSIKEAFQFGELTASAKSYKPEKITSKRMWGEVDYSFELKERIRNYDALIDSYESHKKWARKRKNTQIEDLMNVKIKTTKGLITECKRKLRKY